MYDHHQIIVMSSSIVDLRTTKYFKHKFYLNNWIVFSFLKKNLKKITDFEVYSLQSYTLVSNIDRPKLLVKRLVKIVMVSKNINRLIIRLAINWLIFLLTWLIDCYLIKIIYVKKDKKQDLEYFKIKLISI